MKGKKIGLCTLIFLISSCSTVHPNQCADQAARCKEIKKQIIFNGSTYNEPKAFAERAGLEKLNRDYQAEDCS